jgi:ribosomal-protein-alanine N-acetyltransferase
MEAFPELHTRRLTLRKIDAEDLPSLIKYANNRKISDYVLNIPYPYQEMDAVFRISYVVQGFRNKTRYVFAIELKEHREFIGEVSLHLENGQTQLGYWIAEPFWNQGIATEAVQAVLKFGFETLDLRLIYATCHIDNEASGKVLLNNGMVYNGKQGNVIQYVMTRQGYEG